MMRDLKRSSLILIVSFLLVGLISCTPPIEKLFNKGLKYGSQGKFYEAKQEFQKSLDFNPDRLFKAARDCLKLIDDALYKRVEKEVVIHLFKGIIYGNKEMNEEVIAEINKGIAINPNYADAHYLLGCAYINSGMFNEGIDEYTKAIVLNPNYVEAYNNLAIAFYYNEQYKLAIDNYDKLIELGYEADPLFLKYLAQHR
ncbi:MAG: tetratricopeptide repeat protein [Candidatus Omnitrophica bacterium]|nr:tetratricopeptide repeat protein [Candidatus Omnitrophota bacterium]